jgi:hypothetical protein
MFARAVDMAEAIRAVYSSHNSSPGIVIFGDCLNQNHEKVEFTPDITWAEQWFPRPGKFFKLGTKGYSTLVAHVTRVSAGAAARYVFPYRFLSTFYKLSYEVCSKPVHYIILFPPLAFQAMDRTWVTQVHQHTWDYHQETTGGRTPC